MPVILCVIICSSLGLLLLLGRLLACLARLLALHARHT